jgi:hypothetical protein
MNVRDGPMRLDQNLAYGDGHVLKVRRKHFPIRRAKRVEKGIPKLGSHRLTGESNGLREENAAQDNAE